MNIPEIEQNIKKINARIEEACKNCGRNSDSILLVAVSKTKPNEMILEALKGGQIHFGENRMLELEEKMFAIKDDSIQWHMIGNLQTNKIKKIAHRVDWIHSVEKTKYLDEISKRAEENNRTIKVLIQVNISDERQKGGCKPEDLAEILNHAKGLSNITVAGLMGMATFTDDLEEIRKEFVLLKQLFEQHQSFNEGNIQLTELSMGMSGDLEIAVEVGSTMVRVGSDIFGSRN